MANQPTILQIALDKKLISEAQAKECLEAQQKTKEAAGMEISIEQVLLNKRYLTPAQLKSLAQPGSGPKSPIEGYEILRKLGEGGMGAVYLAKQTSLERSCALKILSPKLARQNPEAGERFLREAQAVAKLQHPNIVAGYDVGKANEYHYFAMEYVDGKSLAGMLDKGGVLSESVALKLFIDITKGLAHAASKGMVHRDIKPDNILITAAGVPKIVDFGLARMEGQSHLTQTGMGLGTPAYISPEQAQSQKTLDSRADIYSLGCTLFHAVCGRPPFTGDNPLVILKAHCEQAIPEPRTLNPRLSEGISRLVRKMCAKKPENRFQSCAELQKAMEAVWRGELIEAPVKENLPASAPAPTPAPASAVQAPPPASASGPAPVVAPKSTASSPALTPVPSAATGNSTSKVMPAISKTPTKTSGFSTGKAGAETRETRKFATLLTSVSNGSAERADGKRSSRKKEKESFLKSIPRPLSAVIAGSVLMLALGAVFMFIGGEEPTDENLVARKDSSVSPTPGAYPSEQATPEAKDSSGSKETPSAKETEPPKEASTPDEKKDPSATPKATEKAVEGFDEKSLSEELRRIAQGEYATPEDYTAGLERISALRKKSTDANFTDKIEVEEKKLMKKREQCATGALEKIGAEIESLLKEDQYGAALNKITEFPAGFLDNTEAGKEIANRTAGIRQSALKKMTEAFDKAEEFGKKGEFEQARECVLPLSNWDYKEVASKAKEKLEGIAAAETAYKSAKEQNVREEEQKAYWAFVAEIYKLTRDLKFADAVSLNEKRAAEFQQDEVRKWVESDGADLRKAQDFWEKFIESAKGAQWNLGGLKGKLAGFDSAKGVFLINIGEGAMGNRKWSQLSAVERRTLFIMGKLENPAGKGLFMIYTGDQAAGLPLLESAKDKDLDLKHLREMAENLSSGAIAPVKEGASEKPGDSEVAENPGKKDDPPAAVGEQSKISGPYRSRGALEKTAARDKYGGKDTATAVQNGLEWLAKNQSEDGSWKSQDDRRNTLATTALAMLAFLGDGHAELGSKYSPNVKKGLDWLLNEVDKNTGQFGNGITMYEQALATMALNEAYGMNIVRVKEKAVKATTYIIESQSTTGGWFYQPAFVGQAGGDSSVTGFQVQALKQAKVAKLGLDKQVDTCLARAKGWVDFVNDKKGNTGNFGPFGGNSTLCAAGGLMRIYTGSTRTDEQLRLAVEIIVRQLPGTKPQPPAEVPDGPRRFGRPGGPGGPRGPGRPEFVMPQEAYSSDMAYLYYGTLLTFQWGGPQWTKWNDEMKKVVLANLSTVDGPDKGSWNPEKDPFGNHWGRAGATAIGVLCLEVYYRYDRILK